MEVRLGSEYIEEDWLATAFDPEDGPVDVDIDGLAENLFESVGVKEVEYVAEDSGGNRMVVVRSIKVFGQGYTRSWPGASCEAIMDAGHDVGTGMVCFVFCFFKTDLSVILVLDWSMCGERWLQWYTTIL